MMEVDKVLDIVDEFEKGYIIESNIIKDIELLYSDPNISKENAVSMLEHLDQCINTLKDEPEWFDDNIKYFEIEILAYRLLKLDECSKNIAYEVLEDKLKDILDHDFDEEDFEKMIFIISTFVKDFENFYYLDISKYSSFFENCKRLIKVKQLIKSGNFKSAFETQKKVVYDLIENDAEWFINENTHKEYLKKKIDDFIKLAIAADEFDELDELIILCDRNKEKFWDNSENILMWIKVEIFIVNDSNELDQNEIESLLLYLSEVMSSEKINGLLEAIDSLEVTTYEDRKKYRDIETEFIKWIDLLFLYIKVLNKILDNYSDYEEDKKYCQLIIENCKKRKDIIDKLNRKFCSNLFNNKFQDCDDIQLLCEIRLCPSRNMDLLYVMRQIESYNGNNYIINRIFKPFYILFMNYGNERSDNNIESIFLELISLYINITKAEHLLTIKNYQNVDLAYYTTLQTFSYLLKDKENKLIKNPDKNTTIGKYRLSIMNECYMNDPNEGKVIYDILNLYGKTKTSLYSKLSGPNKKERIEHDSTLVFLKSFSSKIDKLTMWSEYGDKGKGCCIVVDSETFRAGKTKLELIKSLNLCTFKMSDDYHLYHVTYWDCKSKKFIIDGRPNHKIKKIIENIIHNIAVISNHLDKVSYKKENIILSIEGIIEDLLSKLCNLIKYDEYQDENEVRIILRRDMKSRSNDDIIVIDNNQDVLRSMLYIPFPMKTLIKEVILGPKVSEKDFYVPYLSLKLSEVNKGCNYDTKLTNSSIDYR